MCLGTVLYVVVLIKISISFHVSMLDLVELPYLMSC